MKWPWTVCLEGFRGREVWSCLGRCCSTGHSQANPAVPGAGLMEGLCAWPVHLLPQPLPPLQHWEYGLKIPDQQQTCRNDGKGFPWISSDYPLKENSGLTFRHHLCRERGNSSALPLWNSCDPCWSGKAISVQHHSSSVKQELKTFTNSGKINCWISFFLG